MKSFRYLLVFVLVLSLPLLACGVFSGADPTAEPTQAPPPTETTAPPTATTAPPTPTDEPEVEPAATSAAEPEAEATVFSAQPTKGPAPTRDSVVPVDDLPSAGQISSTRYEHAEGLFALYPPEDWTASEDESSASFDAPDSSGYIYIQVTNTAIELDAIAFTNFVKNRDLNFFRDFDNYVTLNEEIDGDIGAATISKSLSFDGVPQTVITLYEQYGSVIYSFDFWSDEDRIDAYSDLFIEVAHAIEVYPEAAAEQVEYNWIYTFEEANGLFTIDVPTPWRYENTQGESVIVDTFYSPDEHAVIQNITYDDGEEISRSQAGAFGLELLREYYASDIRILDDQIQPDGSERLIWESPGGDYSGTSFLETRGTTFLLFTTMYDNPYEDAYLETLNYTISTYDIPETIESGS